MAAQKVVISKDLKADLQAFFASMSYDKLFILTDTNTQEKCYPLIKDIPALRIPRSLPCRRVILIKTSNRSPISGRVSRTKGLPEIRFWSIWAAV